MDFNPKIPRWQFIIRTVEFLSAATALNEILAACGGGITTNSPTPFPNSLPSPTPTPLPPSVTNPNNGPVIVHPRVALIFYGANQGKGNEWVVTPQLSELKTRMADFMGIVATNSMYKTLEKPFRIQDAKISNVTVVDVDEISAHWKTSFFDKKRVSSTGNGGDFDKSVSKLISDKRTILAPDVNLVMIFLPPGFATPGGSKAAGYHHFTDTGTPYCILPYAGDSTGKAALRSAANAMNSSFMGMYAEHEFFEAIQDPYGTSWFDRDFGKSKYAGMESGDICAAPAITINTPEGPVIAQPIFNPATGACYPNAGATVADATPSTMNRRQFITSIVNRR